MALPWGLRDYRHSIRDELSAFAGLATGPCAVPFRLLHLMLLVCSVHRDVCRCPGYEDYGDSGYPAIELRAFGAWGLGGLWVDDDAG